jgi:hypothetical protein
MLRALLIVLLLTVSPVFAHDVRDPMTPEQVAQILLALDPDARAVGARAEMTLGDVPVTVFLDEGANRMRVMVPVASAEALSPEDLTRVLQANFDTALDARYAIAQGRLWSVFVHPLAELTREQLILGIGQTVNLAQSYGTLYTSGAQIFGQGDSGGIYSDLIEELLERGEAL